MLACALATAGAAPQSPEEPATTASGAPATPRELRALSFELLGRPPLAAERAEHATLARDASVARLLDSADHWQHWLDEQLYYFLLIDNFRPRGERVTSLPSALAAGELDVRSAIHRLALSSSFEQRNPGADTFVTVVMEQLAGLEVPKNTRELEIGKKIYDGAPGTFLGSSGKLQADLVRIAVESRAFAKHFLAREHERILHARPESKELADWTARFHADPKCYRAILAEWLGGEAWRKRTEKRLELPNRMFVQALYVDLVDRAPTREEAEPLREALDGLADPAPLRGVLARLLIDSDKVKLPARAEIGEPGAWIDGLFLRFLAREPTAEQRTAFAAALADPACRPQILVQALVASPEYARY